MRDDVQALIFGPGVPAAGIRGTLSISAIGAEIAAGERHQRASLSQITLREVGFEQPGIEVAWNDVDGAWAAHVLDSVSAQRLLNSSALSGTPQAAMLKADQRKAAVRRVIGRAVLALLLLLPIVLLLMFALSASRIAGWAASHVPVKDEAALGRLSFDSLRRGLILQDQGPAYEAVQSIVDRLTQGSRFTYEVHIAQDESLNAFALPGGVIVVHSGLIAATTQVEELAGVLAHEVQHVELRHSLRGVIKETGLRGLWAFVSGDLGGSLAGQAAVALTSLQFSRDDEREADEHGFDALVAAGIDPAGMPAFFRTLNERAEGPVPVFLSTHPASADRDRELRQRLATVAGRSFQPLSLQPWPPG